MANESDEWSDDGFMGNESDDGTGDSPAAAVVPQAQRDLEALQQKYKNVGYLEGIEEATEEHLQEGFDRGFAEAAPRAAVRGEIRGVMRYDVSDATRGWLVDSHLFVSVRCWSSRL